MKWIELWPAALQAYVESGNVSHVKKYLKGRELDDTLLRELGWALWLRMEHDERTVAPELRMAVAATYARHLKAAEARDKRRGQYKRKYSSAEIANRATRLDREFAHLHLTETFVRESNTYARAG